MFVLCLGIVESNERNKLLGDSETQDFALRHPTKEMTHEPGERRRKGPRTRLVITHGKTPWNT